MNALVIGGTKDFGLAMSTQLHMHGFNVQTVARSNADFICDVSNKKDVSLLLQNSQIIEKKWACIVCVVGLPFSSNKNELFQSNVGYVKQLFTKLAQKKTVFLCFGSRWQLKPDENFLKYAIEKRKLAHFVKRMSKKGFHIIQCIVPPMKTQGFDLAKIRFDKMPNMHSVNEVSAWVVKTMLQRDSKPIVSWFERKTV